MDDYTMEDFLLNKMDSVEALSFQPSINYSEDINDDALSNAWLDNGTSYIWKVGVLTVVDGNKADWAKMYIAHQRSPAHLIQFIGRMYWEEGENDDMARCLHRYLKCASNASIMFED